MKKLDKSEIVFKVLSYVLVTLFALSCLYPFIYSLSVSISSKQAVESGKIVFLPVDLDFKALKALFTNKEYAKDFWIGYSNTLFYTLYGTIFSMVVSIMGAYALSRKKLLYRRQIMFFIVFTMWFSAGMMPSYFNFLDLNVTSRWGVVYAMGISTFNVILLRNYFEGISVEIEEAAKIDGANDLQILTKISVPMSKSAIATITLFYALSRWNGYFWVRQLTSKEQHPLQVIIRKMVTGEDQTSSPKNYDFSITSLRYAAIILSIIPILIVYPYLQKYFAKGVNVGGVKE